MKPTLQLKLSQHLTLTPQLQQSIRLLQLSTLELNQEVERLLQENPLLEKVDDEETESSGPPADFVTTVSVSSTEEKPPAEVDDMVSDGADTLGSSGADSDWGSAAGNADDDEAFFPQQVAASSLRDHLNSQLALLNLPLRDRQIVAALIDALDDDGYLTSSLEELLELFPEELGLDPDELSIALKYLQNMEPAGVGARDAAECLGLQLKALPETTPFRTEALRLAENHLPLLAARDFGKLKRLLHVDDAGLRAVRSLITSLNPRPGSRFSKTEANYVIPDVVVRKARGKWVASLNEAAMPKLRLNRIYADILTRNRDASNQQLAAQLQEAKWLIRNVQQRFETILLVHGCRQVSELAYGEELVARLRDDELFGPLLSEKLLYYPTVTREPFRNRGRITDLISSEQLFNDIHQAPLNIETDRIMMCGSPGMLDELKQMFESGGFLEGSHNTPGHFVIEKAFVER